MKPERWKKVRDVLGQVLELTPERRSEFLERACANDQSLRQEVETLLEQTAAETFMDAPALEVAVRVLAEGKADDLLDHSQADHRAASWMGHRIGSYQIITQIARGGMGEVYLAMRADEQYQKQVAIKLMRSGFDSRLTLTRFKAERQILADLDHPNITRLLDGGVTEEGEPYLVMEYVEGVPLDAYCNEQKLTVRERLELFRTVCAAVHYAHQNLVIHRDIKPGNILVTRKGIVKLLDFGIAKILGPHPAGLVGGLTSPYDRLLTPDYASPEQLQGETITTASDVYSLGVVLYELLTGHRPHRLHERRLEEIQRIVAGPEAEKPSNAIGRVEEIIDTTGKTLTLTPEVVSEARGASVKSLHRQLSGDLDNVVLMALRKEPHRRYTSVDQFSEDIGRHLERLPVVARPDTFIYRGAKFVRRHTMGVVAAALVVLSLIAGLAIALREAQIARVQQARAERRFNDVRQLANSFMFEFHDAIQNLPGSTAARKLVVQKALQYLDSLAHEPGDNPSLQRELAAAYEKLGKIQGYPFEPNLGDTAGSLASFQKAVTIRRSVVARGLPSREDQFALAKVLDLTAQMLSMKGDSQPALDHAREAAAISDRLVGQEPRNLRFLRELGDDYETLGDIYGGLINGTSLAETAASLDAYRKSFAVSQAMSQINPKDAGAERLGAVSAVKIGRALTGTGERSEAMNYFRKGLASWSRLAADPTNSSAQRYLAVAQGAFAELLESNGDFSAALHYSRSGMEFDQRMVDADPRNVQARLDLAVDYTSVGELLVRTGRQSVGLQMLEKSVAMLEELTVRSPETAGFLGYLGMAQATTGQRFAESGRYDRALAYYRKALATFQKLVTGDAENGDARLGMAGTYTKLGATFVKLQDHDQAQDCFKKALALAEPLAAGNSPNVSALYTIADVYAGLGDLFVASALRSDRSPWVVQEQMKRARDAYSKSLQMWQPIHNPAKVTPNGFDAGDPKLVAAKLARLEANFAERSKELTRPVGKE